jgi:hypothetical protein
MGTRTAPDAMKKESRFDYEHSKWADSDRAKTRRWYDELESLGPENVRARLAQTDASARGSLAIGEHSMTIGFAQEWLAWHDRKRTEREANFRQRQLFWARWMAFAATGTMVVACIGWCLTAWRKW